MNGIAPEEVAILAGIWFLACKCVYKPVGLHRWVDVFVSTGWRLGLMYMLASFVEDSTSGILHPYDGLKVAFKAVIVALVVLWFFRLWSGLLDEHTSVGRSVMEFAAACWVLDTSKAVLSSQGFDPEVGLSVLIEVLALIFVLVFIHKAISKLKERVLEDKSEQFRANVARAASTVVIAPFFIAPMIMAVMAYHGRSQEVLDVVVFGKIITIYSTATEFLMEYV